MTATKERITSPSLLQFLTEVPRSITEYAAYLGSKSMAKDQKSGDGHPVLVIPGFMASDVSTSALRKFLKSAGYIPYAWGLGRNYAKMSYKEELIRKIDIIYQKHGVPISIIGWSLGGVFARELAKERKSIVRMVITLGSPMSGIGKPNNANWVYKIISGGKDTKDLGEDVLNEFLKSPEVPVTAIYSKDDGIVPWQYCQETGGMYFHENIEVSGSHIGLGHNTEVLHIIQNRLQYNSANWKPFKWDV